MRKIAIIIMIALSLSACKKERIQKCIIGTWMVENTRSFFIIYNYDEYAKIGDPNSSLIYIDNSNNIILDSKQVGYVKCKGNTATLYYTGRQPIHLIRAY